jgi:hypothetical protein
LADCFLGYALPVFSGCANVTDYFPAEALVRLPDIKDHSAVIDTIADLLRRDPWEAHLPAIQIARDKLIADYNLFSVMSDIVVSHVLTSAEVQLTKPEMILPSPRVFNGVLGSARKAIHTLKARLK